MADRNDRGLIPELFGDMLSMSLGATYKGFELMMNPVKTAERMVDEMKTLMTPPDESEDGLQGKARAMASVWLERGVSWMQEIKSVGDKLTK